MALTVHPSREAIELALEKMKVDGLVHPDAAFNEGAWVMAHDNLDWTARKQMAPYLEFVRDKAHFSESICFDIDDCRMELSIK